MKKTKVLIVAFLVLLISMMSFTKVNAHTVELDPDSLISFPMMIVGGKGNITIKSSETGYSLYYQAVEISNSVYEQIEKAKSDGETELEGIKTEMDQLKTEYGNLKTLYDEAYEAYKEKLENGASETELETLKTAYETARTNYQNKVDEYNEKVEEYNNKVNETNDKIKTLTPSYVEDNWTKTENGDFEVDLSQFYGQRAYAIWVKLVSLDGTITYDEGTYTMSGTKPEEIAVESISLDKSTVTITEGSSYTLTATVSPSDATNKLIIWSSDNENVAKVEEGKITAISEGTTTITATTKDGGYTATCEVTVTKKATTPNPDTDNKEPDSTVAEGELPKAGSLTYIISLAILALGIIGVITYKKVKYLNFK